MKKTLIVFVLLVIIVNGCKKEELPENQISGFDTEVISSWIEADSNYINKNSTGYCNGIKINSSGSITLYSSSSSSCTNWTSSLTLPQYKYMINNVWGSSLGSDTGTYEVINHWKLKISSSSGTSYYNRGTF